MSGQCVKLVETELEWDPSLNAARIGLVVDKSVVTQTCATGGDAEKLAAERIAMHVASVKGVAQKIERRPFGDVGVDDDEIAWRALRTLECDVMAPMDRIQNALNRQAQIHARHVKVTVEGGRVSLNVKTNALPDRAIAERAAWAAPEVSSFVDHLAAAA